MLAMRSGAAYSGASGPLMGQPAGVDREGHVVAKFLVHREPLRIVGVETVDDRVHLDALDAVLAQDAGFRPLYRARSG